MQRHAAFSETPVRFGFTHGRVHGHHRLSAAGMKLLHTIRSLNPRDGGIVGMVRHLVRAGQRRGHVAEVCTLDAPEAPWLRDWPGPVTALGPARGTYGFTSRLKPWLRVHAIDYDAVVMHGLWQYSSFGAWRGLAYASTPHAIFPHGMLDAWFRDEEPAKYLKKALYWPLEHLVCQSAAAVCFTAEEERRNSHLTFRPYNVREVVVGAGIEPPPDQAAAQIATFQARFPELAGQPFILYFGRIHLKKGCDLLAQAFATFGLEHDTIPLVFAGPDTDQLEPQLRALLPAALQARVHFTGMLDGETKWGALRSADVFIIPSHQENFCLAAAEALACGTPALVSDKVNIWREIVEDGAGLVQPDSTAGTLALLQQWAATPATERDAMRLRARECFARHFSIDRVYDNLTHVFDAP